MTEPLFSQRHGLAPQPDFQADDYLPPWAREAVANEMAGFIRNKPSMDLPDLVGVYSLIRPYVWKVLGRQPPTNPMGGPWAFYIPRTLAECSWWQFYDILEQISQLISQHWGEEYLPSFSEKISIVLAKDGIPWRLDQGRVVRSLNPQVAKQIQETHTLLTNPRFRGPDEQFAKAVECLNKRPDPEEENCVKDAVGAMEAVANIIAGTTGVQLNILLDREPFRSAIHPAIRQAIDKIYAYRGAAPGVAHGQIGPSTVGVAEATWVLTISAATILYLVRKFPQQG